EVAVCPEPGVMCDQPLVAAWIADRDPPRPGEQRRLDRARHQVATRADVVAEPTLEIERPPPQDRVSDEAVLGGGEQRLELSASAGAVEAAPHDRVEARVPVPLPGIAAWARDAEPVPEAAVATLAPVRLEQRARRGGEQSS